MALFQRSQPNQGSSARKPRGEVHVRSEGRLSIAYRVLLRPHVTEKAGRVAELNQYVFVVAPHATKPDIAQAVFEAYGIKPVRVRTARVAGKRRRLGRTQGWIAGYKKAIVTLPTGKTIDVLPK